MTKIEKSLKYLKDKYNIQSVEQLIEEVNKMELDIGIFTMPYVRRQESEVPNERTANF